MQKGNIGAYIQPAGQQAGINSVWLFPEPYLKGEVGVNREKIVSHETG